MKGDHSSGRLRDGGYWLTYRGQMPSKNNYRYDKRRATWKRIPVFESDIGQLATKAGAKRLYGKRILLIIRTMNQAVDPDNIRAAVDALKGIVYPDDSAEWIGRIIIDPDTIEDVYPYVRMEIHEFTPNGDRRS